MSKNQDCTSAIKARERERESWELGGEEEERHIIDAMASHRRWFIAVGLTARSRDKEICLYTRGLGLDISTQTALQSMRVNVQSQRLNIIILALDTTPYYTF